MTRLSIGLIVLLLLLSNTGGLASAAWADHFPSPESIGPGTLELPGATLNALTPELKYVTVSSLSYVYVFAVEDTQLTLAEQLSKRRTPILVARVNSSSLQIPAGILLPGKSYYWYVESTHAPGSKSEATKTSQRLYFSTAKDSN